MKKQILKWNLFIGLILLPIVYFGCKKSESQTPQKMNSGPFVSISTSSTYGNYLVDKNGVTLYFFSNDYQGMKTCTTGCDEYWPPFYAGNITQDSLGSGLLLADFDTINEGGVIQTRYKGWPLYYFSPAGNGVTETAGQITGDGSNGIWFVAKPDYTIMLANGQLLGLDGNDYTSSYSLGTGLTTYMTDANGLTLYTFSVDSFNENKFTNASFSNNPSWPIYDTTIIIVPSVLNKTNFSTTTIDMYSQLTYNGWPLYHFGQDKGIMGSNKGVSAGAPGKWPVAVKNMANAPEKSGNSNGGGGY